MLHARKATIYVVQSVNDIMFMVALYISDPCTAAYIKLICRELVHTISTLQLHVLLFYVHAIYTFRCLYNHYIVIPLLQISLMLIM